MRARDENTTFAVFASMRPSADNTVHGSCVTGAAAEPGPVAGGDRAAASDRHEATVAYWVEKHGLKAVNREKHAARGGLSREELERLVEAGASIAEIAEAVGRSKATVRHWLREYGLKTRRRTMRQVRAEQPARLRSRLQMTLSAPITALPSSSFAPRVAIGAQVSLRRCHRRRRKVKRDARRGGGRRCQLCGYDTVRRGPGVPSSRAGGEAIRSESSRRRPLAREGTR